MAKKEKEPRKSGPGGGVQALRSECRLAGRSLSTAVVEFQTALAERHGIGPTDVRALDLLERFGPLTAGAFGELAALAPASVSSLMDRLEAKGFARRERDREDGRRVLLRIHRGRDQVFDPVMRRFGEQMDRILEQFTADELAAILRFLVGSTALQKEFAAKLRLETQAHAKPGLPPGPS